MTSSTPDAGSAVAAMPVRLGAEFFGTFVLVLFGCGAAVLAATASNPDDIQVGIGYLGVALAFGLAVTVMAYAVGHLSGGHFNPAVTIGLAVAGRVEKGAVALYIAAQVLGASAAGGVLYLIAAGKPGADAVAAGFATNGFGARSPEQYSLVACLIAEVVMTAVFVSVVLGATDDRAPAGFAPLAIGLTLVVIHLVTIPVTNTSVNPARSLGVAWFVGGPALAQVWLFIVAPIAGAVLAGVAYPLLTRPGHDAAEASEGRVEGAPRR